MRLAVAVQKQSHAVLLVLAPSASHGAGGRALNFWSSCRPDALVAAEDLTNQLLEAASRQLRADGAGENSRNSGPAGSSRVGGPESVMTSVHGRLHILA